LDHPDKKPMPEPSGQR